jgi:hypothetical protein
MIGEVVGERGDELLGGEGDGGGRPVGRAGPAAGGGRPARAAKAAGRQESGEVEGGGRSLFHVGDVLEHVVRGLDGLGIDLIGALRRDQVHHLLDDVDVGGLEVALLDAAVARLARLARLGRAAGRRFRVKVAAEALQAGRDWESASA